jgi:hypothetical protein
MRSRRYSWRVLSILTALAMVATVGLARASVVNSAVVDTTAPTGSVDLEAGQSAAIQINLFVTGKQDGTATFKVNRNWSLSGGTFTGSNPQTFTVDPREATDAPTMFSTSGTVSVAAGQVTGTFLLSVSAFDITNSNTTGSKLSVGAPAPYLVRVVPPSDSTPPVITANVSGTLGANGWYTSDVTVSWSVTDPDSSISSTTGCTTTTISTDTGGQTLTCSAKSAGGTASKSVTIKRDATAPTLTATPSPAANPNGYNNSPVDVSYACSDATSGLADPCPATDSATTDGTHVFSHTIHDKAGNSASVSTTVNLDATKPSISGSAAPPANANGWNNSDVTVTFVCSDTGTGASGIASCVADGTSPGSDHATLSSDGANQSVSGTATDKADNSNTATVSGINIDKTAPVISFDSRTAANANGWNSSNVTVTWTCSDPGGSGVLDPTVTQTLTSEGGGQSTTGTCQDRAGNQTSDTVTKINIDKTAPAIAFDNRTPANANGWNNADVTVTWNCSDGVSGPVHDAVAVAVADEGANQSATGICQDLAGNQASDTHGGINIDKTAPGIAFDHQSPAANANGWNNTDVTLYWTCTDALSGPQASPVAKTLTTEGSDQSATGTCSDKADNTTPDTQSGIDIDKTKPTLTPTVSPTPVLLNGSATASANAADDRSGLASSSCDAVDTSSVGSHTVACTASDNAGNQASASASYSVNYASGGSCLGSPGHQILQPINANYQTDLSVFKQGSTVPAKFRVCDANGVSIGTAGVVTKFTVQKLSLAANEVVDEAVLSTTPDTAFRWSATDQQWIFNISTKNLKANTTYVYQVTLNDGTTIDFRFGLK